MKTICAFVFAFVTLPAFAQAPDVTTTAPYYSEDYFGEFMEPGSVTMPTVTSEPTMEKLGDPADATESVAIIDPDHAVDVASGAIHQTEEPASSAQSIDAVPSEKLGEGAEEADDVTTTGSAASAELPVDEVTSGGHVWWP